MPRRSAVLITYNNSGQNPVLSKYTKLWIAKKNSYVTIIHGSTVKIIQEGLQPVSSL